MAVKDKGTITMMTLTHNSERCMMHTGASYCGGCGGGKPGSILVFAAATAAHWLAGTAAAGGSQAEGLGKPLHVLLPANPLSHTWPQQ